jgi:SAM-dependent methyltransferase
MLRTASCDKTGTVFLGQNYVYRTIVKSEVQNVKEVLKLLGEETEGLVETEIVDIEKLPIEFADEKPSFLLRHRRVEAISYPHEWCALMLRDAALFQLSLISKLYQKDLFFKDCHPLNILFERGQPIFVDYTSIVTETMLFSEEFLNANKKRTINFTPSSYIDCIEEIFIRMFMPYFSKPLLFYAFGERSKARERVENTTLNASTDSILLRQIFPKSLSISKLSKLACLFRFYFFERSTFLMLRRSKNLPRFLSKLKRFISSLPVSVGKSSYSDYYQEKSENQDYSYSEDWNEKQTNVFEAINSKRINTVLDVACNTGWFSKMAERHGKFVKAFDVDEACVELLYREVRDRKLNILPLVLDFTNLTKDRFSIYDGNPVLINAADRLRSDSVIALGILHHLVLGLGLRVGDIIKYLDNLSIKQVVLEFIELDDQKITDEPEFFTEYFKDKSVANDYNLENVLLSLENLGFEITVKSSFPSTRKILVCNKI